MSGYSFSFRFDIDPALRSLMQLSQRYSQSFSHWERLSARFSNTFGSRFQSMTSRASQSVAQLTNKLNGLTGNRVISIGTGMVKGAIGLVDTLLNKLKQVESSGNGGNSGEKKGGWLSGLSGMARGALPALGVAGLMAGGGSFASMGMNREMTEVAFEQFLGKGGVAPMMKQLNRFADVTPYSNEDVYGAGRNLLAAKVGPGQINEKLTNIGNLSAVAQKDFGETARAYAMAKQRGVVGNDLLENQFSGTAVRDQLMKNLGVNGDQLFKMAEKRQVRFGDLDKALSDLSAKGGLYEGGLEKQSGTAKGKWSTFTGTLENKVTEWAKQLNPYLAKAFDFGSVLLTKIDPMLEKLKPIFDVITTGFGKLWTASEPIRELFQELWGFAGKLWDQFVSLTGGTKGLEVVFNILAAVLSVASHALKWAGELVLWLIDGPLGKLVLVLGGVTAAFWAFNVVAALNPFTIWITFISAFVVAIKYAWDNVDWFREGLIRLYEVAKSVGVGLVTAFDRLKNLDLAGAKNALSESYENGLKNAEKVIALQRSQKANQITVTGKPATIANAAAAGPAGGLAKSSGAGSSSGSGAEATSGGKKATTINVNINTLVQKVEVHALTLQEGMNDIEAIVEEAFLRVVNSVNSMSTN